MLNDLAGLAAEFEAEFEAELERQYPKARIAKVSWWRRLISRLFGVDLLVFCSKCHACLGPTRTAYDAHGVPQQCWWCRTMLQDAPDFAGHVVTYPPPSSYIHEYPPRVVMRHVLPPAPTSMPGPGQSVLK
jgi:hypothetical protein